MKDLNDVVRGWINKADSDLVAMNASFEAGALDAACFHAQQASEKTLKAYLTFEGVKFPFTHNLSKLVQLCQEKNPEFSEIAPAVEPLTPYAVELRYDVDFSPSASDADAARDSANAVRQFVLDRLPKNVVTDETDIPRP